MRRMKTVHQWETGCAVAHRTRAGAVACCERRARAIARENARKDDANQARENAPGANYFYSEEYARRYPRSSPYTPYTGGLET